MTITEATILGLIVKAKAIEVDVMAMRANDSSARETGLGFYTEQSYLDSANNLHKISRRIIELANSGEL